MTGPTTAESLRAEPNAAAARTIAALVSLLHLLAAFLILARPDLLDLDEASRRGRGVVLLLLSILYMTPVLPGVWWLRARVWSAMVAALAEAIVFAAMACLAALAAFSLGDPRQLSIGVLLPGSIACLHLFLLLHLWPLRRGVPVSGGTS